MPYKVPPSRNYRGALAAMPTKWDREAPEGNQFIPVEIIWGDYSPVNAVNLNVSNYSNLKFSQITTLIVDNSDCGADIRFSFPDSETTVTVPAYSPYSIIPVVTNAVQFFIETALDNQIIETTDVTRFQIHNSNPPPLSIPQALEQSLSSVGGVSTATAITQVVALGVNGTLENACLQMSVNAANSGRLTWQLVDGSAGPLTIAQGSADMSAGDKVNVFLFNMPEMRVRFTNGLKLLCQQTLALGAIINVNLYFRTP